MTNKTSNPATVAGPFGAYSQMCEISPPARLLQLAGQVGIKPDGTLGGDADEQCFWAFSNVLALLAAAGMSAADITKTTIFLTDRANIKSYRKARDELMADLKPPNTLLLVSGLANPAWLIEIEAQAAQSLPSS